MILVVAKTNGPICIRLQFSSKGYELFVTNWEDLDEHGCPKHWYAIRDNMYQITYMAERFLDGENPIEECGNKLLKYAKKDGWSIVQNTFQSKECP